MRYLMCALLLFPSVAISQFYVGGNYGKSNLNYDVEGSAYRELSRNNNASYANSAILLSGNKVSINSDRTSRYGKIFIGKKLSRKIGLEVFYTKFTTFNATAKLSAFFNDNVVQSFISGNAKAIASITSIGVRLNGFIPISKEFELLASVGVSRVKAKLTTSYTVSSSVNYAIPAYSEGTGSLNISGVESFTEVLISPLMSVGIQYKLTEDVYLRSEVEVLGLPINGLSIITGSTGFVYSF